MKILRISDWAIWNLSNDWLCVEWYKDWEYIGVNFDWDRAEWKVVSPIRERSSKYDIICSCWYVDRRKRYKRILDSLLWLVK